MPGVYRKRGKGDSYLLEVCIGTDYKGKPIRYNRTVHCKSDKGAEKELAKFYVECEAGNISSASNLTIENLCKLYLREYAELNLKKSTLLSTKTAINIAILPSLGGRRANSTKRIDIQQWVNELTRRPGTKSEKLSPKTVRNYYSTLRTIMQFGVSMSLISSTPCHDISLPKKEHTEANYYNRDEVAALINCLETNPDTDLKFKTAIFIALFGGLRKGEILGLNWDDVIWDKGEVQIRRSRMAGGGAGVYEDTPKTERSIRSVSLPREVLDKLKALKTTQKIAQIHLGNKWQISPAIFKGEFGQPMYPQVLQRWFANFLRVHNLRSIGLHGLRHTHTSMLAFLQKDKLQISRRLGHSQLSTTLDIYTHLFEETDQTIANDLSSIFLKNKI